MALEPNEKAEIAGTIASYIKSAPLESISDFPLLTKALKTLTGDLSEVTIDSRFQTVIDDIKEYMSPEWCAVRPIDRPEFLEYCKEIINQRIKYLEGLSDAEKTDYLGVNAEAEAYDGTEADPEANNSSTPPETNLLWLVLMSVLIPVGGPAIDLLWRSNPTATLTDSETRPQSWHIANNTFSPGETTWEMNYTLNLRDKQLIHELTIRKLPECFEVSLAANINGHTTRRSKIGRDMFIHSNRTTLANAIERAGINRNTAQVRRLPNSSEATNEQAFCMRGSAEEMSNHIKLLCQAIGSVEEGGEPSQEMQAEIIQAIELSPPTQNINRFELT